MAIVDDRGRVAGRVNLIDALVAIVIVVLIPVTYGAYLLFRTPAPKLTGIAPTTLYEGPNLRIGIAGKNLRPFMRVSFNTIQGRTFMIGSTTNAAVDLPDLPPGTYDVVLFDYVQEVDRLPKALRILPGGASQPIVEMEVAGAFLYMGATTSIVAGQKFPPSGDALAEVLAVSAPIPAHLRVRAGEVTVGVPLAGQVEIPATLRVKCYVNGNADGSLRCLIPGPQAAAVVAPDSNLTLQGPQGWVSFQISEVHVRSSSLVARARATLIVTPTMLSKIKVGDTDTSARATARAYGARIVSLDGVRPIAAGSNASLSRVAGDERALTVTLQVPIERVPGGWTYKQEPFKIGAPFSFETPEYVVHGEVLDFTPPAAPPAGRGAH